MSYDETVVYLLYLASWRLAVVGAGAMCIYLGYRLFALGFDAGKTEMQFDRGGSSVKLRNLAPGTAFALFGAVLIGTLVVSAPPEIIFSDGPEGPRVLLRGGDEAAEQPTGELPAGASRDPVTEKLYE